MSSETAAATKKKLTPMMQQYHEIRGSLPSNTLLLFRLGDFYELFEEDAYTAAKILGITLTKRHETPMAGIPFHAAHNYINKVLAAGMKVAICDQLEAPTTGKLVERGVTRILTPGTTLEEDQLSATKNHYLLALNFDAKKGLAAAWVDLSTGSFKLAHDEDFARMMPALYALDASEIIVPEGHVERWEADSKLSAWMEAFDILAGDKAITHTPEYQFDGTQGIRTLLETLSVLNLDGFGIGAEHPGVGTAAALIHYISENLRKKPENIRKISEYKPANALLIDPATLRNLEILKSSINTREGSLLGAMDQTVTAAGARQLEEYLCAPSLDLKEIHARQSCIGEFLEDPGYVYVLRDLLKEIRDLSRILGRLQNRSPLPRELGGIRDTLAQLPGLLEELGRVQGTQVASLGLKIEAFEELSAILESALAETLPAKLTDGGCFKPGYDPQLDRLVGLSKDNKQWLAELEQAEQEKSGIKNLKIKYNGAFGYFIEVSKSQISRVPEHYVRKQTMTNAERYITEELKLKEREILEAESRSIEREGELFKELVERTLVDADGLYQTASALAQLDVLLGWSKLAHEMNYCKPQVDDSDILDIKEGRHPVVEQMLQRSTNGVAGNHSFVPNDTFLSTEEEQIALITGPNMAGKSTYIRQVALITLMAQVGSWVPAKSCRVGYVDRIFSRVGASDELARGNSTFMVEMNETANILNNHTARSLVILDEIGRGTSTYDGLSIAWAVIEHLHGEGNAGPRTLFATHYHELTELENTLGRLRNYTVSVKEWNEQIIFVRQVIPGCADRSYGIQVAKLAGLPASVIARAERVLEKLEGEDAVDHSSLLHHHSDAAAVKQEPTVEKKVPAKKRLKETQEEAQLSLF